MALLEPVVIQTVATSTEAMENIAFIAALQALGRLVLQAIPINVTRDKYMQDINIDWQGPLSIDQALQLHADTDHGLYQYYGDHPIYGQSVLLYLGSAIRQSFGRRLSQHNWHDWTGSPVQIYVGRLHTEEKVEADTARQILALAEAILLFSHSPGFNTSNLNSIGYKGEDVRVMNWGKRKSLLPEVSISRWDGGQTVGHSVPKKMAIVSYSNP
jgi:hypothetical protein